MSASPLKTEENVDQHVQRLLDTWRTDTAYLSSSSRVLEHPAYQELINLGSIALPALFRDLEKTRDGHLSKALSAVTGVHPIPKEDRGQICKIAETWLRWAKENGLQW